MGNLKKRPLVLKKKEDIDLKQLENIFQHYDETITAIDKRRIAQQPTLATTAALEDVVTKVNILIEALNDSDLTEND